MSQVDCCLGNLSLVMRGLPVIAVADARDSYSATEANLLFRFSICLSPFMPALISVMCNAIPCVSFTSILPRLTFLLPKANRALWSMR